ncbi:RNA-binding protein 48-like [Ipomoea triloba]|uniref:RNA-binding protein 48-like n=1 Tax=Ipomoea triloba TaxID=35885 RepID=UPI00125D5CED|nr:RNA-binding protein 48-like [Ipomoea triloba]XP_031107845.1 RNA-binding protein 48-like [Ipomoea triloba]
MPRYRDETPAVCVYTVCDESKFLIVRNVPALGCGDDLAKLFTTYGEVEECKPMDAEDCEPFTDVYWIKFQRIDNARFAKRKLDEFVFLGNRLQVSYAPQYESLSDTKEKLEGRRREVLTRVNSQRSKSSAIHGPDAVSKSIITSTSKPLEINKSPSMKPQETANNRDSSMNVISSNKEYFSSESMNQTVQLVREKLNKIQSSAEHSEAGASKKVRVDNRRRI